MLAHAARPRLSWPVVARCFVFWFASVQAPSRGAEPTSPNLPLKRVVLYSSGVGFFEHRGDIEGDQTIEMRFDTAAINDLLKSMVVQDFGGGHISTVTYSSREPLAKQLKSFSIDLARNPSVGDVLRQLRGQTLAIAAPNPIEGAIVSTERRRVPGGKEGTDEIEVLNLKTAAGVRSIPLYSIVEFRLSDKKLNDEFQDALAVLATAHANDKKAITLSFAGKGRRPVTVGYIQESPVWKTSYRLVLDDKESPLLQGWAVVENTTEHDWKDVSVTLVSGRPISFTMNLYEPLYVDRPVVVPETFAGLTSHTYAQDLSGKSDLETLTGDTGIRIGGKPVRLAGVPQQQGAGFGGGGGFGGGFMGGGMAGVPGANSGGTASNGAAVTSVIPVLDGKPINAGLDLKKGVTSAATADAVGELFRYSIKTPVTLAHSKSALLPIVNEPIKGQRVAIYNPEVQPKHPLAGLWLHNTTKLHLMQGPITVFDGGEYAGDAQIEDISPGARRLISYALDLDVEVTSRTEPQLDVLSVVKIVHGVIHATNKLTRQRIYTIKNSGERPKHLLIEQPIDAEWKLTKPEQLAEKTRDEYRFATDVADHKTGTLAVAEERSQQQEVALGTTSDAQMLVSYRSATVASPQVKAALAELATRWAAKGELATQRFKLEAKISEIGTEQARIRQNMDRLDKTSELFNRYVKMFGEQEDLIAKTRGELKVMSAQEDKQRKELADFVSHLDVE